MVFGRWRKASRQAHAHQAALAGEVADQHRDVRGGRDSVPGLVTRDGINNWMHIQYDSRQAYSPSMTISIRRLLLALCLTLLALLASAKELRGRVVRVADGDTLTLLDANKVQHKIRLNGIDAPEKGQAFGQKSQESLAALAAGREVVVTTRKQDRYGRSVGKVLVDGADVNLVQVERGLAWFYRQYQNELTSEDRQKYKQAENDARTSRRGLWVEQEPVPPWDWRRRSSAR